jgi:hypothetical protein
VSPKQALSVGLKVDVDALPANLKAQVKQGKVNLDDPAVTAKLIQLGAVVGVRVETNTPSAGTTGSAAATGSAMETGSAGASGSAGATGTAGSLPRVGITCAFCHSTVDDSVGPGIGKRLDGWPNRDLNVGAIVAMSPNLDLLAKELGVDEADAKKVLMAWGPGKFDAELILDGKGFRPDGKTAATLIPPAYGLAGVNLHTFEGWGSVPYWNAFVANLEMNGMGTFFDPRLDDSAKFPLAAKHKLGHVRKNPDLISRHLPALQVYQLSIPAPSAPTSSFDATSAAAGKTLFEGRAKCSRCHVPPTFSEPGWSMHTGSEIGIDDFQANRSPDGMYRTTPLKGAWAHAKGGYYHDGRFADLTAVVEHYDKTFDLGLTSTEKQQLTEYLKSL